MTAGIYDSTADILFHAAICLSTGRRSSIRAALVEATKKLHWTDDVKIWRPFHDTYLMYKMVNGHDGEAWPMHTNFRGGAWLTPEHKSEQIMSVLFTYEYLVQELGALRSPLDLGNS